MRQNFLRLLTFFLAALIGIVIGVWYGNRVGEAGILFRHVNSRIFLLITKNMSIARYFFTLLFETAVIVTLFFLFAFNYYVSFFNYILIIFKGYVLGFNVFILIYLASLSCVPFIVFCYVPFSLAIIIIFSIVATRLSALSRLALLTKQSYRCFEEGIALLPFAIFLLIICAVKAVLAFILTAGIMI